MPITIDIGNILEKRRLKKEREEFLEGIFKLIEQGTPGRPPQEEFQFDLPTLPETPPENIILEGLIKRAPELAEKNLPTLVELSQRARQLRQVESSAPQLFQQLETVGLSRAQVEALRTRFEQDPIGTASLIDQLILTPVKETAEAMSKTRATLAAEESPEGRRLREIKLQDEINKVVAQAEALLPIEVKKAAEITFATEKIRASMRQGEVLAEHFKEIQKKMEKALEFTSKELEDMQDEQSKLLDDEEVNKFFVATELPSGHTIRPYDVYVAGKQQTEIGDFLKLKGIPLTPENLKEVMRISDRFSTEERLNPRTMRKLDEYLNLDARIEALVQNARNYSEIYNAASLAYGIPPVDFTPFVAAGDVDAIRRTSRKFLIGKEAQKILTEDEKNSALSKIKESLESIVNTTKNIVLPISSVGRDIMKDIEKTILSFTAPIDAEATIKSIEKHFGIKLSEEERKRIRSLAEKRNKDLNQ